MDGILEKYLLRSIPRDGTEPSGGAAPAAVEVTGGQAPVAAPSPAPQVDWRDRRIAQLTARQNELRAELAQARAATPAPAQPGAPAAAPAQRMVPESELNARASQMASIAEFNRRCTEVAGEGQERFGTEFVVGIQKMVQLVDRNDPAQQQNYNDFLQAALDTEDPAKVLFELGKDQNEVARLLDLPVGKRVAAMVKLATPAPLPPESAAPRPITPVTGKATPVPIDPGDPDKGGSLPIDDWMARRQAQVDAQRSARRTRS